MEKRDVREVARVGTGLLSWCGGESEATARSTDLHRASLGND